MDRQDDFLQGVSALSENFAELFPAATAACELASAFLSELAHLLLTAAASDAAAGGSWQESLAEHYAALGKLRPALQGVIPENAAFATDLAEAACSAGEASLCRKLFAAGEQYLHFPLTVDRFMPGEAEELRPEARGKITYFQNAYSDAAYACFAAKLHRARAYYQTGFEAVCEDVYNGESEYGILPAESTEIGRLSLFYSLIDRYELHIVRSATVHLADGQGSTRFVLLRKALLLSGMAGQGYAELQFFSDEKTSLGTFLDTARRFGMSPTRVDAVQRAYPENTYHYDVIFSCTDADVSCFVLYLLLRRARYAVTGIYTHIDQSR